MKKIVPLIMCIAMLLCACADTGEEQFAMFVSRTAEAENISFTADVRTEYDDKTAEFKLRYEQNADGASVEVIEPEMLAGIKAHLKDNDLSLEYDGAMLNIGTLEAAELSPMSALPLFARALTGAHTEITWVEGDNIAARLVPADDYLVTVWISAELAPISAEISYKEQTVVFIDISDWSIS